MKGFVAALLLLLSTSSFALTDVQCKAYILFKESHLEPLKGQRAVLSVINNRMTRDKFSCYKVMTQKNQWSFYRKGMKIKLTPEMIERYNEVRVVSSVYPEATHFHSTKIAPAWSKSKKMQKLGKVGNHVFYKQKERKKWNRTPQ